jgi:membrane associated rhomboid family serine protease
MGGLPDGCFIQRPYRGPIAYSLRSVIYLFAGLSLASGSSGAAGGVMSAGSVFFQTAPNLGLVVFRCGVPARNAKPL